MGRRGTPEEITSAYLFVASYEASYVTGAIGYVDGGTITANGPTDKKAVPALTQEPAGDLDLQHSMAGNTSIRRQPVRCLDEYQTEWAATYNAGG